MTFGMNQYEVTLERGDMTERVKVNCNNPPYAIKKAIILVGQKTRLGGWKYKSHRLVRKGWDDCAVSMAECNRRAAIEVARGIRAV